MSTSDQEKSKKLLQDALLELRRTKGRLQAIETAQAEPIAVVGMGCKFPGGVESPEALWDMLKNGVDAITDMVDERWNGEEYYDANPEAAGKLYTKGNGLVSDVDMFDADFFGIAPLEARLMDPQQRLLLESTWNALEHAGIAPQSLFDTNTGVFVGICHQGYSHLQAKYCGLDAISPYSGTGNAHSIASGRLSYLLGVHGPSISVDTACSSSLVALHLAVQSLRKGESDVALAGGVNLILEPTTSMIFARAGMLAKDGRCKTFDADADGYVRGEGCGMVVLKRLRDAQAAGDRILAVIKGSAVNQDGKSQGITAPNERAQEAVIRAALQDAAVSSDAVSYVEAHGTGTSLGDPIELAALNTVYGKGRAANKLNVGSIKTNIGHLEAAAGIAGFMKVVLALQHGELPAHLHFNKPNPYIDWNNIAIDVTAKSQSWQEQGRLAGLSSFGFSGTNAHLIIGEAPQKTEAADRLPEPVLPPVLLLSAKSQEALNALITTYVQTPNSPENARWVDICHTANAGRNHFRFRLSVIANSFDEAKSRLNEWQQDGQNSFVSSAEVGTQTPRIAFLFSGQGAQYIGMAQRLYQQQPVFQTALDRICGVLAQYLDRPLLSVLWGDNAHLLNETCYTQPAIFAIQIALAEWWRALGITPSSVTGHSIGEYAAAVCAGVWSVEDAARLICARGRLMQTLCRPGAMVVVYASVEDAQRFISNAGCSVSIAAVNGPGLCVISGEKHAVEEMQALLTDAGIRTKALDVSHAFHSRMMEPMLEAFREEAERVSYHMPRIRFVSSCTGQAEGRELLTAQYWVRQISDTVRFSDAVKELSQQKFAAFLEIGPGSTLIKLAQQSTLLPLSLKNGEAPTFHASLQPQHDDEITLAETIAGLYARGFSLQMSTVAQGLDVRRVALPTYPYQKQSFWIDEIRIGRYHNDRDALRADLAYRLDWTSLPLTKTGENPELVIAVGAHNEMIAALANHADQQRIAFEHWAVGESVGQDKPLEDMHYRQHFERLLAAHNTAQRLAIVFVADPSAGETEGLPSFIQDRLVMLMALTQAIIAKSPKTARLWLVTQNAFVESKRDGQVNIAAHPLLGWCKSIALEHGDVWGGMVDIVGAEADSLPAAVAALIKEVAANLPESEIRLVEGERFVRRLQRLQGLKAEAAVLDANAQYMITGGLGGIGLSIAQAMADSGARHIALVSRSGGMEKLDEHQREIVDRLQAAGVAITIVNTDVTCATAVGKLVQAINTVELPLRGIVHAAGVSEICTVEEMSAERMHRVTEAKIGGAWNLHRATLDLSLEFFTVFSSIASVWGSGGMAHYVAANHFLDGLVAYRRQQGRAANAIQWGPWGGGGMAAGDAGDQAEKRGLRLFSPEQGVLFMRTLWNRQDSHVVVVDVAWERFKELLEVRREQPLLSWVARAKVVTAHSGQKSAALAALADKSLEQRAEAIVELLRALMARVIGAESIDRIDPDQPLMELGIDSIMALEIKKQLEAETGTAVQATLIFDYPTIRRIADHFAKVLYIDNATTTPDELSIAADATRQDGIRGNEAIAIIGIGSRLPKAPEGPADFWQLLVKGESGICDVPSQRWNITDYLDKDENAPGKTYTLSAGLIDDLENFDARFFGIAPREIESMEPQQRLVLETSWAALENAGYAPLSLNGSSVGVFMGVGANEYVRACAMNAKEEDIMFIPTGNASNVIAGRVSFTLGLQGPAMVIDTACSSSAVAIHTACQSLRNGECELALAGGVNAIVLPETFVALSKAHMLSKEGRCKTFDEKADGYVRGEGVGVLVLKRLSDAQRDGDNIVAIIRGSAVNQDGRSSSLTAPNGPAQQAVIRAALKAADVTADEVDWIETHGTATPLGDPIEVQSLDAVYGASRSPEKPLLISAVKTNIGHLESAAGVSSVIKVALALQHGLIPAHLHFKRFNPHIAVDASHFHIPTDNFAWNTSEHKRIAGVSSFGFSGTNVHIVLEEAPARPLVESNEIRRSHVITLSAKNEKSLEKMCKRFAAFLEHDNLNTPETALADIAFTANTGREHFDVRLALVCNDKATAAQKLKQLGEGIVPPGAFYSSGIKHGPKVAFLFTGQGSQYADMGKELYEQYLPFREAMDECAALFREETGDSLLALLWGDQTARLDLTQFTQPALFCLEYSLAQAWTSLGLKPTVMVGHSVGEYAAAVLAGIMTLQDGMRLIVARGRLMVQLTEPGDMAAIMAPIAQVNALLARVNGVAIAACNAPNNTVVSGEKAAIAALIELAAQQGIEARALTVSHAFHSPMMQPMLEAFSEVANSIDYKPAQRDIVSSVSGRLNQGEMSSAKYWVDHVRRPVLFADAIMQALATTHMDRKPDIVLEIGPGATLLGLGQQNHSDSSLVWLNSLRARQDACKQFCLTLAQLYCRGVSVQWKSFDVGYARRRVAVPGYAFDRKRYWLGDNAVQDRRFSTAATANVGVQYENLLAMVSSPMSEDRYFENTFTDKAPFNLDDHRLYEVVVSPGAFHVAMAVTCARDIFGDQPVKLDDIVFPEPLIFEAEKSRRLHYGFRKQTDKQGTPFFEVRGYSRDDRAGDANWTQHTSMNVSRAPAPEIIQVLTEQDIAAIQERATHTVSGDFFYGEMWKVGYHLGPQFRWIEKIWRRPGEALTLLRLPQSALEKGKFVIHPGLMDSCFQSSALATGHQGFDAAALDAIYIPFALENVNFYRPPTTRLWCHVKIKSASDEQWAESFSHSIQVYDEQGNLLIDVDTLHSKRAPKDALLKALRKNPLEHHYEVHWKEQPLKPEAETKSVGTYWIVGDDARSDTLAKVLRQRGAEVRVLHLQSTPVADENALNWRDAAAWMSWLHAQQGLTNIQGVIYLPPMAMAIEAYGSMSVGPDSQALLAEQANIYGPLLALIKSVQLAGATQTPKLWCVTQQSIAANASDTDLNPGHASLHGFINVVAMEHPEFNAVLIDLESNGGERGWRMVAEEIAWGGQEKRVALRRNGRWVPRLARCTDVKRGMPVPAAPYRLVIEKKGTFDDLKFVPFEPRQLGSTEVRVKVLSAGLNFRDVMGVLDVYPGEAGPLGGECIGEIMQLGEGVSDFAVGDRVMVPLAQSCMSTQTQVEHLLLCRVPRNLTINEAATIPVAYCTALYGLQELAQLQPGERVLIHAGAGGVGLAAIYIAWQKGAEVIASASERKRDFLREIGVKHVVDSRSISFAEDVRRLTDGEGVDVVLNSLAGEFIPASMALLRENGRFIEIGKADIWTQERVKAFRSDIQYAAFDLVMVTMQDPMMLAKLMHQVVARVESDEYRPLPFTVFRHSEAMEAFRYMAQGRHIGKILINPDPAAVTVKPDRSYLITGASGGLGLLFAKWLVMQGARELVLVARRDVRQIAAAQVSALEALGARVHCCVADIGDGEQVSTLMSHVTTHCLPLAGVLHAAGVLKDAFILNQNVEAFDQVMAPKLAGCWHLHQATKALDLDMFVLFSSLSSLLGAPGQVNYASANAFLDGLAHYRRAKGLPAISVNWGPWAEVGMAATANVEANAAAGGVSLISPEEGLAWFAQILQANPVERGVFEINWSLLAKGLGAQLPAFVSELDVKSTTSVDSNLQKMAEEFRARLLDTPSDERTPMLVDMICDQIKRVMGLEANEQIDPQQPLQALGLDSLMAVELRNILCALIGRQLPATLMFKYPTVASLSAFLIADMFPAEVQEAPPALPVTQEKKEETLDHLSEADLEAMLMAELNDTQA